MLSWWIVLRGRGIETRATATGSTALCDRLRWQIGSGKDADFRRAGDRAVGRNGAVRRKASTVRTDSAVDGTTVDGRGWDARIDRPTVHCRAGHARLGRLAQLLLSGLNVFKPGDFLVGKFGRGFARTALLVVDHEREIYRWA
jgi:hypothetical protein